ncbi:hypothetical protein CHUAL_013652 [Chamberlinius hualienensis]
MDNKMKKTRFRLTEEERLKCLEEFLSLISEDITTSEDALWQNLLDILSRDHERFKLCTIRNLKNNVLDQVQKYKTYDVAEATESGRERLQTKWGDIMKMVMTVWSSYETLTQLEAAKKVNTNERKHKISAERDAEIGKKIRHAAVSSLDAGESICSFQLEEFCQSGSVSADESNQVYVESVYNVDSPMPDTFSTETPTCTERKFTKPSRKSRQTKAELKLREKIEMENINIRNRQLELDEKRLEADEKRLEAEMEEKRCAREERLLQLATHKATTTLLNSLLQSSLFKIHN